MTPCALIIASATPVPKKKKTNTGFDNLNNFCPISNLAFFAKLLEQIVASQL